MTKLDFLAATAHKNYTNPDLQYEAFKFMCQHFDIDLLSETYSSAAEKLSASMMMKIKPLGEPLGGIKLDSNQGPTYS